MCLSVEVTDLGPFAVLLDLSDGLVAVSDGLIGDQATEAIRDVLHQAGVPQLVPGRITCRCGMFLRDAAGDRELVAT